MARESFEVGGTVTIIKELFVNITIDREERPNVGSI